MLAQTTWRRRADPRFPPRPARFERTIAEVARGWAGTKASAAVAAVAAALSLAAPGCGTDARGIETCRKIEEARCRQLPSCPSFGVQSTDDVEACVRFYRDQCLHGLAGTDPGGPAADSCVQAIEQAGACAMQGGEKAPLSSCAPPPSRQTTAPTACFLLSFPETAAECSFLVPPAPEAEGGAEAGGTTGGAPEAGTADGASDAGVSE